MNRVEAQARKSAFYMLLVTAWVPYHFGWESGARRLVDWAWDIVREVK